MKHNVLCRKNDFIRDCVMVHEMAKYFRDNPGVKDHIDNIPRHIALYLVEREYFKVHGSKDCPYWHTNDSFYEGNLNEIIQFYWRAYKIGENEK